MTYRVPIAMIKKIISSSFLVLFASTTNLSIIAPANAQLQKCQDAQGKWHYGNDLRDVCKNEDNIKSVRSNVKSPASSQGASASDQELARLELKVLETNEYLTSDLQKLLSPYKSKQEVEQRFERLKSTNTEEITKKEDLIEGLKQKEIILKAGESASNPQNSVQLSDTRQRIKSAEAELAELQTKSGQIDQRRAKMLKIYDQFNDKFGPDAKS